MTAVVLRVPTSPRATGVALFLGALVAFASYDALCKQMLAFYPAPFINRR